MNFIIFDLEATCWKGSRTPEEREIIEIGAFRLNPYGDVEDSFNRFVKPCIHPFLSSYCQELTTIRQVDVNRADYFPKVVEDFQDWGSMFDEDYILCSWGDFDQKLLFQDCDQHDIDSYWVESYIDLKQQYKEIRKLNKSKGLKSALRAEGFEFEGTHHRAIDYAENLINIFLEYLDVWRY